MNKTTFLSASVMIAIVLGGCDKATNNNRISLHYVEDNSIQLYYPSMNVISISGGDGTYALACSDESILEVKIEMEQKTLVLTPLSLGKATVTISDRSNNVYTLNVNISYRENDYVVKERDVRITGENLTEEEKREIEEKAISTIPVEVNGGYKFIYTGEDGFSGKVIVYAETFGENGKDGIFEEQISADGSENSYKVIMQLNGRERVFYFIAYDISTRSEDVTSSRWAFTEDITEWIRTDYPDVESAYTEQVL
jgi:hypothetical protein